MIRKRITQYDSETGEIYKESDCVVSNDIGLFTDTKAEYVKVIVRAIPEFNVATYQTYLRLLFQYLEHNTNRLVKRTRGIRNRYIYTPIIQAHLGSLLNIPERTYLRFMKDCFNKQYLYRDDKHQLFMNPAYVRKGNGSDLALYDMFKGEKEFDSQITPKAKQLLGLI